MKEKSPKDWVVISHVLMGKVELLGSKGTISGIAKQPVSGRRSVGKVGFTDDHQADLENHGGEEKAIHQYPFDHYELWRHEMPDQALLKDVGAFGENLSTRDLREPDVCIGDIWRAGTALLQISQGRQPCFKLNLRFGVDDMAYRVQKSLRCGWYYRVLEPGEIEQGDTMRLLDRPNKEWSVARALGLLFLKTDAYDELESMSQIPELADSWRRLACRRVKNRKTEDWTGRLNSQ